MEIKKIAISPAYRKENGTWVLHINKSLLPEDFNLVEQSLISIPPEQFGGNHKHPRKEAFVATSQDLVLYWLDEKGNKHEDKMSRENQLYLFVIPPFVPHTVVNKSKTKSAILYEFANDKQHDVEVVKII